MPLLHRLFFLALLTGVFSVFPGVDLKAQKVRFTDTSNRWMVRFSSIGMADEYQYSIEKDTVVSGLSYRFLKPNRISTGEHYPILLVRDDTVANKVYFITVTPQWSGSEQVLYDFNLGVGDSLIFDYPYSFPASTHPNPPYTMKVRRMDSTQINGVWHKVWYTFGNTCTVAIVEGIGSLHSPSRAGFSWGFEYGNQLTCFHHKGSTPVLSKAVYSYFENSNSCTLAAAAISVDRVEMAVRPNPVTQDSKLYFEATGAVCLSIHDMVGKCRYSASFSGRSDIPIGRIALPAGMYCCRLRVAATGQSGTCFFIIP